MKLQKITDEAKIITLICYLLSNLGELTESMLLEIATVDDLVPQFKLSDSLAIAETKGLASVADKKYSITQSGKEWLSQFESSIAPTLRGKILRVGKEVVRLESLKKAIKWNISREQNNWIFYACFVNEIDGSKVMELRLFSKTEEGAVKAQEKFLQDPAKVFSESIGNLI